MPTLLRILKRTGIEPRDDRNAAVHHGRRVRFDLEKAAKLYVDNEWNAERIGELLGVNASTILRRLRESGVMIRHHNDTKRGKPNHRRIDLDPQLVALEYAKQDADIKSLMAMFGVTKSIIRRAFDAAGVETKKRDRDGAKNPNWRPDLTAEERALRRDSAKQTKWRIQVYERDGYKCQRCGDAQGGNLNAHHVEAHCQNTKDRNDPDNGITLCVECHRGFHRAYGLRGFGRKQLAEWLENYRTKNAA
ncbi:HNH endonuclease [Bradyrhizobium sp. URHD0069]|uniref:HNH endonuclease n=1 Tax=Bradyrhizobium sp. URHD0069 TaxID=1380355 RepID=UPI0018CC4F0C|nr:HNH endonuclease [Bradyrhizobium sp. URHD0069]